jgi:Subtilisin-like serine proteases
MKNSTTKSILNTKDEPLVDSLNYGNSATQITQIKVNQVHNDGIYGQGVLIASLDNGWRNQTHEAFTTLPMKVLAQKDFQLNLPYAGNTTAGHGTTTLSTIGGYKPGQLIGPAFGSYFIVARTEVDSFERPIEMDNWAAAAYWADSLGADVITSSLGYSTFDAGYTSYTYLDMNGHTIPVTLAAVWAMRRGITVFNSAGNSGSGTTNTLGAPADADTVITAGAVNPTGVRSSFSSVGPTTDSPPRIKPDIMAMGEGVYTATTGSTTSYNSYASGTSYSCPLAAGVGALVLSANKNLTPVQVRNILRKFASNNTSPNNLMGWGIIDAKLAVDSARKFDNVAPVIAHTRPFGNTTDTSTISVKAKITDNGIIRNSRITEAPRLYYRKKVGSGTWSAFSFVNAFSVNSRLDTFTFKIPGSVNYTQVEYYFAAQDIALPTSLMSTLPPGGSGINPPGTTAPATRFTYTVTPFSGITGNNPVPYEYRLYGNYPNPFNPETSIRFSIAKSGFVSLKVYDITGRLISDLLSEQRSAGEYSVMFNAGNLASGLYFARLESNGFVEAKRMLLIK